MEGVLPTDHMYLTPKEGQLKDAIAFVYGNGQCKAPNSDAEEGGDDIAVVGKNMTDARREDDEHAQLVVILSED